MCGIDLRGYLGERESVRVFGRWKVVLKRTLRTLCELTCYMNRPSDDGISDTPQGGIWWVLTPFNVAFAAAWAFAWGFLALEFAPAVALALMLPGWRRKAAHMRH